MSPLERLQHLISTESLDAYLITNRECIAWLTGFTGSFSQVVVTPEGATFLTDSRYTEMAASQVSSMEVRSFASPKTSLQFLAETLDELQAKRVGFQPDDVMVATLQRWQEQMPGREWKSVSDPFGEMRMIKTPEEITKIRAACQLADAAFQHVLPLVRIGVSELQIHLEIEFYFKKQGADISFTPIVVSGANSALPHGRASHKLLEAGDFVTMDFGALLDGYCSDLTRTVVVGTASERHREIYNQILKAQTSAIEAMKPGIPAKEVDKMSREVLAEKDLAKYFGHGLGHGLGRVVHDPGALNATSTAILAPNQVWTVEPGVYIPKFGGVRIEDDVVVTESGVEVLTSSPKELLEIR